MKWHHMLAAYPATHRWLLGCATLIAVAQILESVGLVT